MTSKLKCPFCGKKLWYDEQDGIYRCMKFGCVMDYEGGTEQLWQALTQAKQDLEITTKALNVANEKLRHCVNMTVEELDELKNDLLIAWNALLHFSKDPVANNALEKITASKQKYVK